MPCNKTKVFLTGATGVMGMAGLKELCRYPEKYEVTVLARENAKNHKKIAPFEKKGVNVIWGDLLDKNSLKKGIEGSDIVLHVGGMVSPMAEHYPEQTMRVNIGSMKLIAEIVKDIEDRDSRREIKVVYIGSVSQYGTKLPPDHWGRVGDKLRAAKFDAYAVSKILAERTLVESGIKKWVSIRQTGILHPGLLNKANDPVAFHFPLKGVLEWITAEDSGRLLERVCRNDVPEEFWGLFYNAGGGEPFRLSNIEFERGILKGMGCPRPEKIFDPKWFATDNFHGMWFEDSDELDSILHFREPDSFIESIERMKKRLPAYFKFTPLAPAFIIKIFLKNVAGKKGLGPLSWIKYGDEEKIKAFWGSREEYSKIGKWEDIKIDYLQKKSPKYALPKEKYSTVLRKVKCEKGHEYEISEALEKGGHGCPHCLFIDSKVKSPDF